VLADGAERLSWSRWYVGVALAVLIAATIALAWAAPAAWAGGDAFGREIFWAQSADRVASTTHHLRPPWFYVVALPVLVLPWLLLWPVWRGAAALIRVDATSLPGLRVAVAWLVPVLVAFSLFRGKQPQYLLPEVPGLAFLMACALNTLVAVRRWESWLVAAVFALFSALLLVGLQRLDAEHLVPLQQVHTVWISAALWSALALAVGWLAAGRPGRAVAVVGTASVAMVVSGYAGVGRIALASFDVAPMANRLAAAQAQGRSIAHLGKYHGQYQFVGRLQQPLQVIEQPEALRRWAADHPDGGVIAYGRTPPAKSSGPGPEFMQKFKGGYVALWRADDVLRVGPEGWRNFGNGAP
jgi:4-amino-4-deoxy-L-arabinose transferase-like glycosyltransferase